MPSRPCLVCGELTPRGSWCKEHEPERPPSPSQLINRPRAARRLRASLMQGAGYRCQRCGSTGPLELHHLEPAAAGGKHEPANLVVLCRPCHRGPGPPCG